MVASELRSGILSVGRQRSSGTEPMRIVLGAGRPVADAVEFAALQLNHLQFLTIRRYLSLVFATLVTLLLVLAIWS